MKILVLLFSLCSLLHFSATAQTPAADTSKCYDEYKAMFAAKGAYQLNDGLYKTIVTIRLNGTCMKYEGKARIVAGKFQLPLYVKNEKGEYVTLKSTGRNLNKNYDAYKLPLENKVVNGVSPTYISDKDELVDIFLIELLKQ